MKQEEIWLSLSQTETDSLGMRLLSTAACWPVLFLYPSEAEEGLAVFCVTFLVTWAGVTVYQEHHICTSATINSVLSNGYMAWFTKAWKDCEVFWDSWTQAVKLAYSALNSVSCPDPTLSWGKGSGGNWAPSWLCQVSSTDSEQANEIALCHTSVDASQWNSAMS